MIGRAHPNYKDGSRSKYSAGLPSRMLESYERALSDGKMLQLRDEVALLDARLQDLLTRVDSGESGRLWERLATAHTEFSKARSTGKVDEMQEKLAEMEALIAAGRRDTEAWREVHTTLDLRRKLVESERKRILEAQQAVTAEQLTDFMGILLDVIGSEVTDPAMLSRVSARLTHAITEGSVTSASSRPAPLG